MKAPKITSAVVVKVAKLAGLPLTKQQIEELTNQVGVTIQYVSQLQSLPTGNATETSQVTGLENVFREDVIDNKRTFTQEQALANAKRTHNGFFVVDAVFNEE